MIYLDIKIPHLQIAHQGGNFEVGNIKIHLRVQSYLLYWRRRRISGNSCNAPIVREIWMIMMFLVLFFLPLFQSNVTK